MYFRSFLNPRPSELIAAPECILRQALAFAICAPCWGSAAVAWTKRGKDPAISAVLMLLFVFALYALLIKCTDFLECIIVNVPCCAKYLCC